MPVGVRKRGFGRWGVKPQHKVEQARQGRRRPEKADLEEETPDTPEKRHIKIQRRSLWVLVASRFPESRVDLLGGPVTFGGGPGNFWRGSGEVARQLLGKFGEILGTAANTDHLVRIQASSSFFPLPIAPFLPETLPFLGAQNSSDS